MAIEKKDILVYGNFYYQGKAYGGEITKTRNIYKVLTEEFGANSVDFFNMESWKKRPISLLFQLNKKIKLYKCIVILPGPNNLLFILPFLSRKAKKYCFKIFYPVVGGFLAESIKKHHSLRKSIGSVAGIYAETKELVSELETIGVKNVHWSPVFSLRKPMDENERNKSLLKIKSSPIRFCTFSRVVKEKGITTAIKSIAKINSSRTGDFVSLDVYGAIDPAYKSEFANLLKENKEFLKYGGFLPDEGLLQQLSGYYALLFPTYYYGEGFPATLLESYMAGLPIIASDWRFNPEIVMDKKTGLLVHIDKTGEGDFVSAIEFAITNRSIFTSVYRENCFLEAEKYLPKIAAKPLIDDIKIALQSD
jgi:glycosyltransferase involved in cell wall biosynthesis